MDVNAINVNPDFGQETSQIASHVTAMVTRQLVTQELENVCNVPTTLQDSIAIVALKDIMEIHCWVVKSDVVLVDVQTLLHQVTHLPINVL